MATVLNRTTFELRKSVNTPDFPVAEWVINPDLTAVSAQPVRYWKIVGNTVVVMNAAEMAVADTNALPRIIPGMMVQIDDECMRRIELGFQFSGAPGLTFSLSTNAQLKWMGLFVMAQLPSLKKIVTFPLEVPNIDDTKKYDVKDPQEVEDIFSAITVTIATHLGSAQATKGKINGATTVAEAEAALAAFLAA